MEPRPLSMQFAVHAGNSAIASPEASTVCCDRSHAPGLVELRPRAGGTGPGPVSGPPLAWIPLMVSSEISAVTTSGASRCGCTRTGSAIWMTDDRDQGHRHRRDGAPQDQSGRHADRESEQGQRGGEDAAGAEEDRRQARDAEQRRLGGVARGDRVVDRAGPPGQRRDRRAPTASAARPVTPSLVASHRVRVTLWCPHQPMGAGLELTGDHRRAPEHSDDCRHGVHERGAEVEDAPSWRRRARAGRRSRRRRRR